MKVVKRTDSHTIYQKRSNRYAVKNAANAFVNGDEKAAILKEAGLITLPEPKAEEPAEEESTEDAAE